MKIQMEQSDKQQFEVFWTIWINVVRVFLKLPVLSL